MEDSNLQEEIQGEHLEQNPEPELSYEEEQLQMLLIQESEKLRLKMDRELKEAQEKEYQESLQEDLKKNLVFDEPTKEEMRAIRLKRFEKG